MSAAQTAGEPAPLTGMPLFVAAISISLGFFLVILDITIANVSVPHIAGSMGVSSTQGTWIITSYAVAEAICLPLTGWLAKRLGTLHTYIYGLIGFMIASALCGASTTLTMLIVFRVIQGLCGAPLIPLCQALLLRIFPKEKASVAVALSAMVAVLAPLAGPVLGGYITDNYSWRWIFYVNIPFVLLCLPLVIRMLAPFETPKIIEKIDVVGLILLVIWVGALQIMFDLGREYDWFSSALIVSLAIIAGVVFLAFLIWELTEEKPIVDLSLLRYRGFWTATLCISIGYGVMMAGNVMIPLWAQTTLGYTATMAGYVLAPVSIFSLITVPLAGRIANRIDKRIMICWGLSWMGVVSLIRASTNPDMTMFWIAMPQLLQGLSTAFFMLGLTLIALGSVPPKDVAAAAGLMAFTRTIGTAGAISWSTTVWEDKSSAMQTELVGVMNGAGTTIADLMRGGMSELQARATLERLVEVQSSTIAYDHLFFTIGLLCLIIGQFVWIIPKPKVMRA